MKNSKSLPVDETRSKNMAAIRSRNTGIEVRLRKALWASGIRGYRLHYQLPGKPDVVFPRSRLAIFVDGCFWHRCPKCFQMPKTRLDYWTPKIAHNVARDAFISQTLQSEGWKVLRFWEHEIHHDLATCIQRVSGAIPYVSASLHLATRKNTTG
jgi:DNA mismatch endonuclease (patch repair protein)